MKGKKSYVGCLGHFRGCKEALAELMMKFSWLLASRGVAPYKRISSVPEPARTFNGGYYIDGDGETRWYSDKYR